MEPLKLIKHALDTTIGLINHGENPTTALEKEATALDLNPNYIQRTGEALNVALHYSHFNKTAGENRAADFPVADITGVTKTIFGEVEKTAAQVNSEWFKKATPEIDYNKRITDHKFNKIAKDIRNSPDNFDAFDTSIKGQYRKAVDYISSLDKEVDDLRTRKVANDAYLEAVFNATVKQFKKTAAARSAFHEFETSAFAEHGPRSVDYIELLYKTAELSEPRGTHDAGKINFSPTTRELELFGSLLKAASLSVELSAKLAEAELYTGLQKAYLKKIGYSMHSEAALREKEASEEYANKIQLLLDKHAGDLKSSLIMDLYNQLSDATYEKDKPSVPFKNTQMDDLNRSALLQELIMTDPILRHQPPQKVLQAYQSMLRMAPHLAQDREVVRALLRQLTASQSIGPHDANQWIEANTNLMKQHQLMHASSQSKEKK